MKKIPTLFARDPENRARVIDQVTPGCEWVLAGEGVATRKWDGTCVKVTEFNEKLKRREIKPGKPTPPGFVLSEADARTGKAFGWLRVSFTDPNDQYIVEAFRNYADGKHIPAGTYEAVGPNIQGNPEQIDHHTLKRHGESPLNGEPPHQHGAEPRTFRQLREIVVTRGDQHGWEGIVFHHPDGRTAKIKRKDFS